MRGCAASTDDIIALEPELQRLLRDPVGRSIIQIGKRDLRGRRDRIRRVDEVVICKAQAVDHCGREDMHPVRGQSLQVIHRGLPVGSGAQRAIQFALAQVVFQFKRLAKPNAIPASTCQSIRSVVRKSCSGAVEKTRSMRWLAVSRTPTRSAPSCCRSSIATNHHALSRLMGRRYRRHIAGDGTAE